MGESQWLTEQHYLVCPKGLMFKQMKVTSQQHVSFSGHLAATTADTLKGNSFICMSMMPQLMGVVAGLMTAATAMMALPGTGVALNAIMAGAMLFANNAMTMKCKMSSATRLWVGSSPNLIINRHEGLIVGKSKLLCPSEGAMIDIKPSFYEAMVTSNRHNVGHIANFSFGFLAGRGLGTMNDTLTIAPAVAAAAFNPSSLSGEMSWLCRALTGAAMLGAYQGQMDIWANPERSINDKMAASGLELVLAIFAAKGASITCFPAGTMVHTSNGLLPIEEIPAGTNVWTVNEQTGDRELKPILETHRRTTLNMMIVELDNGTLLEATPEHPFMVNGEWIEIKDLETGTELEKIEGQKILIKNIGMITKSTVVYNFSVQDNENYFVTEDGILVHNARYSQLPKHYLSKNKLKPNYKYRTGEYEKYRYITDHLGRIIKGYTRDLDITRRPVGNRLKNERDTPGKLPGDEAGHLIGDRFGGSPKLDNLVSQTSWFNQSEYKKIENMWEKKLGEGCRVKMAIYVNYTGNNKRPSSFDVWYQIDDEQMVTTHFAN